MSTDTGFRYMPLRFGRRVSLGGRIVDPGGLLGPRVCVNLVACSGDAAPRTWQAELRGARGGGGARYFFLDLPLGDFSVSVGDCGHPPWAERAVRLVRPELDPKAAYALQVAFDLEIHSVKAGIPDLAAPASLPINVPR